MAEHVAGVEQQTQVSPPKRTMYVPVGYGVERNAEGEYLLNFMITPFEAVTIVLATDDDRDRVVRQLTGGVAIARTLPPGA